MNGKESMSNRLPPETYLFCLPNRYVFSGAEVYEDDTDSLGYSSFSDEDSDDYNDNPEDYINLDKKPEIGTEIRKESLNGTSQMTEIHTTDNQITSSNNVKENIID